MSSLLNRMNPKIIIPVLCGTLITFYYLNKRNEKLAFEQEQEIFQKEKEIYKNLQKNLDSNRKSNEKKSWF
ncbi:hypothetical protein M0811_08439 [Anaeramoeba ignava]|uniref:Uncharacterized protein n=1 Tax=Anaeramoeba ignava TaxID=1746090 RepID=A0A9Q0RAZ2_ANAIG|nr:hypothetical protein M0811_08439 [Anaeramoeba ignava]